MKTKLLKETSPSPAESGISSTLRESRLFRPTKEFSRHATIKSHAAYKKIWTESITSPTKFWKRQALDLLTWIRPFKTVLTGKTPDAKWFEGGLLNVSVNCIDRHLSTFRKNKAAIIWEGENGDARTLTYQDLHRSVCKFANVLKALEISAGDRVTIYMPLVPEAIIAMLACARIGAIHTVVFAGFSSDALADRNNDAGSKVVVTADGSYRKGSIVALKDSVDEALKHSPTVKNVVVFKRTGCVVTMTSGRDHWWHELEQNQSSICEPHKAKSEDPLFILYTSGSTGKPKGILHTTAGYLLGATLSTKHIFDLKEDDTYWCTADVGWITGHTYVTYGPLSCGASVVIYEGAPSTPDWGRFWQIIEKYRVTIFYTAPTAIRSFIKAGEHWPQKHDLSSLRLLGTVGEPINPEAWMWYYKVIGKSRCPIVDTWWQTETGSAMISPLPGAISTTPGTATKPFFGIDAAVVDKQGKEVAANVGGYLVIRKPWPSMLRSIWNDPVRYRSQYWSQVKGFYFTGDGARKDSDGNFWIMGRIDDVLNVSGHRLSTMEIESSLVGHESVAEAAVVGRPDEIKGEGIVCFVTLKSGHRFDDRLKASLAGKIIKDIGALARPDDIRQAETLPKTRSGKIMRRLLREIASGKAGTQDMSTLEDRGALAALRNDEP
jgi:acetyl-CoA synthetase